MLILLLLAALPPAAAFAPPGLLPAGRSGVLPPAHRSPSLGLVGLRGSTGGGPGGGKEAAFGGDMAGRGDLRNGVDRERNKQVTVLKKLFYYSAADGADKGADGEGVDGGGGGGEGKEARGGGRAAEVLGVLENLPLCRWEALMLPGFNSVLNVWQPMYTHMFEGVISAPQPWCYVHLHTPGGTANFNKPEYRLELGSKAPLVGTLMRVVAAQRLEDSRLALVVQGLARVRVLEQTKAQPYARATVQLLPDAEVVRGLYDEAAEALRAAGGEGEIGEAWVHTVAHAGAVAGEVLWREFESAGVPLSPRGVSPLVPLNASAPPASLAPRVREAQAGAMREAAGLALEGGLRGVPSEVELQVSGVLGGRQSGAQLKFWGGAEPGRYPGGLEGMELRVWLEIDGLIRRLRRLDRNVPIPSQLVGLLPPEPESKWPAGFGLEEICRVMEGGLVGTATRSPFVRVDNSFCERRRAQRFSFAACSLLGLDSGLEGQAILEAASTEHRLSMLMKLFADINAELDARP